jgi:hypothetical protein
VDTLISRYWDDIIDGDRTLAADVEAFAEPFYFTAQLQAAQ